MKYSQHHNHALTYVVKTNLVKNVVKTTKFRYIKKGASSSLMFVEEAISCLMFVEEAK